MFRLLVSFADSVIKEPRIWSLSIYLVCDSVGIVSKSARCAKGIATVEVVRRERDSESSVDERMLPSIVCRDLDVIRVLDYAK